MNLNRSKAKATTNVARTINVTSSTFDACCSANRRGQPVPLRRWSVVAALLVTSCCLQPVRLPAEDKASKPNILIVLADDMQQTDGNLLLCPVFLLTVLKSGDFGNL